MLSAFALAFALFTMPILGEISNCGKNSIFTITQLSLSPSNTVRGGENVSLTLLYTSPVIVSEGSVKTSVTYNFIPLSPTTSQLCSQTSCPIQIGTNNASSTFIFPEGVSGSVVSKVVWENSAGKELLCIKVSLKTSWL